MADGDGATARGTPTAAEIRRRLLPSDEADDLARLFRLLGDPSRMRILSALREAGELYVGDIAEVLETSETSVSQALRLLRTAGVVRARREGRHVCYRLDDAHVQMLLDLSREHLDHTGAPDRETSVG